MNILLIRTEELNVMLPNLKKDQSLFLFLSIRDEKVSRLYSHKAIVILQLSEVRDNWHVT